MGGKVYTKSIQDPYHFAIGVKPLEYVLTGLAIDFSKVNISTDTGLRPAKDPVAVSNNPGEVNFTWTNNTSSSTNASNAFANDKAMLVVYCPDLGEVDWDTAAASRSAGTANLDVSDFSGLTVHTWIAFITDDGKGVSRSMYTGLVSVQ